jgi:DNA polymerase-3 subunit delta'
MSVSTDQQPLAWHAQQWGFIAQCIARDQLPHAILLRGPKGVGKSQFAQQLAQLLLCVAPQGDRACGHCAGCAMFLSHNHPDFFQLVPEGASQQIGIAPVRQLSTRLQHSAHQKGYQVVIIDPMQGLTRAAANALLKTLEEPAGKVCIIGTLDSGAHLLPTLLSRMVPLQFFAEARAHVPAAIQAQAGDYQNMMLEAFSQAPTLCIEAIESESWLLALRVLDHVGKSLVPRHSALYQADQWAKENAQQVLTWLYWLLADCVRIHVGLPVSQCVFSCEPKKLTYVAKQFSLDVCYAHLNTIGKALADAKAATAFNAQYLVEQCFVVLAAGS